MIGNDFVTLLLQLQFSAVLGYVSNLLSLGG